MAVETLPITFEDYCNQDKHNAIFDGSQITRAQLIDCGVSTVAYGARQCGASNDLKRRMLYRSTVGSGVMCVVGTRQVLREHLKCHQYCNNTVKPLTPDEVMDSRIYM
jgi:hypothetical protein